MRVFVVCPVFPPEPIVSSQTAADIAAALASAGHDVTVLTAFPNRPGGKLYQGYRRRLYSREQLPNGVKVVRCFATLSPESRMLSRFFENITFGFTSSLVILTARRADVVYANTWAIFAAGLTAMAAWLRRSSLVTIVQDVYPESLVAQGRIQPGSHLAKWMRWVDQAIARRSRHVILLSRFFLDLYRTDRQIPAERLHLVRNWIDGGRVTPDDPRAAEIRQGLGIPAEAVVFGYGGNIGVAAGVETVIESFIALRDRLDLYLLIAGEGSQLVACQQAAASSGNSRIKFYTPWPAADTSAVLSAADVLLLPTRGDQSRVSVPSKLIAYMLAARPVLAVSLPQTDLADVIEQADCGWLVPPDQPEALTQRLRALLQERDQWSQRGRAGRAFALEHLTRESCLPQIITVLEAAAQA